MENLFTKQEAQEKVVFEEFELGGETFEVKVTQKSCIGFFGKYEILVRKKGQGAFGDVAEVSPSYVIVEGERYPHRFFEVNQSYRGKGMAKWLLDKLKLLDDEILLDYVRIGGDLINFYKSNGYTVQKKTKASIYTILESPNYK